MFLSPYLFWIALAVIFLLVEIGTVALVSLWFTAGSLAALFVCWLGGSFAIQTAVFLLVSGALLALFRSRLRRQKLTRTNVDSVIGTQGLVTEDIDNILPTGQVKLGAMTWTARSSSGEKIPAGTQIRADRVEGVKVFVTPVNVPTHSNP